MCPGEKQAQRLRRPPCLCPVQDTVRGSWDPEIQVGILEEERTGKRRKALWRLGDCLVVKEIDPAFGRTKREGKGTLRR